eukprot:14352397-Alexandrium_andersonii.AAC.1
MCECVCLGADPVAKMKLEAAPSLAVLRAPVERGLQPLPRYAQQSVLASNCVDLHQALRSFAQGA